MKAWKIRPGRDDMHALQMLGYGNKYRDLNRRRIGRAAWLRLMRWMA